MTAKTRTRLENIAIGIVAVIVGLIVIVAAPCAIFAHALAQAGF